MADANEKGDCGDVWLAPTQMRMGMAAVDGEWLAKENGARYAHEHWKGGVWSLCDEGMSIIGTMVAGQELGKSL